MTSPENGTSGWAVRVPTGYRVGGWEVTEPIATGSWSSVYAAERVGGGGAPQRAALKFLPTGTVTQRQLRHLADMAAREVRLHARLHRPRLVRTYEVLTVDDPGQPELDGSVVLAMERAADSLDQVLRRGGSRPVPEAPRLISEICEGLAQMHAAGWVHGDVKPGNVLLMPDGSVRLTDFGLTGELEDTHAYLPPAGTSDYAPPEGWVEPVGEHGRATRTSADIWALGVTACQLLTGQLPFPGATPRARAAAAAEYAAGHRRLLLPATLPDGWAAIVRDCLAPTHELRRRHDAATLLGRIRELAGDGGATPRDGDGRRPAWARRWQAASLAALVLVGGVIAARELPADRGPAAADYRPDLLRVGVGIPQRYRRLIVEAGTTCAEPGLSPVLIAAMLKVESNFDANLSDPAADEYGIARWTPRVLRYHLPPGRRGSVPVPPFSPEDSIPAMGRFMCRFGPSLEGVPGDRALLLAATYRTSASTVVEAGGVPARVRRYTDQVREYMRRYDPGPAGAGSRR